MARYDRGYDGRGGYRTGSWSDPWGGGAGGRPYDRESAGERPWVGGYRGGYQGGSGGVPTGGYRGGGGYDRGAGYGPAPRSGRTGGSGRDYWWIGEHAMGPGYRANEYDRGYRSFDDQAHPRFSPVGGTYAAMGGEYMYHRPPRPLREDTWFSDWTRWF